MRIPEAARGPKRASEASAEAAKDSRESESEAKALFASIGRIWGLGYKVWGFGFWDFIEAQQLTTRL